MRRYEIYLIEDEVAQKYFNKESKLLQLFLEAEQTTSFEHLKILYRQVHYITKPVPVLQIEKNLKEMLGERQDYKIHFQNHWLDIQNEKGQAKLTLTGSCIMMSSSGGFDAEMTFFEILRKTEPCFMAVELHQQRCGWLSPIKQNHFIQVP